VSDITVSLPALHPGQQRIESSAARHKIVRCGRRFGKTKYGITKAAKVALGGGKCGLFYPTNKYSTEAFRELVRRLRPVTELPGGRISEQEKRIELPNGGVIEVWSLDANDDPARGRDYDLVVVDEAGLVGNLLTVWEAAIEPTLLDRNGSALILGTPKGSRTPFNVMFADAEFGGDDDWAAFHGATADNTTIPEVAAKVERARKRAEKRGTLALWRQEYLGEVADDGANPFGLAAIAAAITKRSDREVVAWGVDLARAVDFTVAIGLDAYGRWARIERFQADWGETKRQLIEICGKTTPVVMDSTGVGNPIVADLQYAGMYVEGFVFSRKTRGVLIDELITAVHAKSLGIPDGFVRAEMESLGVDHNTETGFIRYAVPDGGHDDGLMALAMAWRCYQHYAQTPEWPNERFAASDRWQQDQDAALIHVEADDTFTGLGDGW
jgi:hypothetical protein